MKRILALVLSLAMTMSLLAGCSSSDDTADTSSADTSSSESSSNSSVPDVDAALGTTSGTANSDEAPDGVVAGSSVTMYSGVDFSTSFRPGQIPSMAWAYAMIYDTLFWSPSGNYDDMTGQLVETYTVSDDGCTWILDLHEGVFCQNGTEITGEVTVAAMAYSAGPGEQASIYEPMESYTATGDYQVTVVFYEPNPEFMYQLCVAHVPIWDSAVATANGEVPESYINAGSGPYYVSDYASGDYVVFTAVEDHWNPERQAHIETVTCEIILDSNTQTTVLQTGEVDFGALNDYTNYETLMNSSLTIEEWYGTPRPLWVNAEGRNEVLTNVNVRQALSMMIDTEQLAAAATGGYGYAQGSPFPYLVQYDDGREYDPDGALALLAEEGIDPSEIVIEALSNAQTEGLFSNLQAQFNLYGVTLNFVVQDDPAVMTAGWGGEWDIWAESGGMNLYGYASPVTMLLGATGMHNTARIPEMEDEMAALVVEAFTAEDRATELEILADMAALLDENYGYLACVVVPGWNAWNGDKIENVVIDQYAGGWRVWDAWVAQ